jgi:hypothetical protein
MHHAVGVGLLIALIAFAFGKRTAQVCVGAVLIVGALFFLYIAVRVVTGTI